MNNSHHAAGIGVLLLSSVVNALGAGAFAAEAADGKPNILWIIIDDQRADALVVHFPRQRPCDFAYSVRVERK